LLCVLLFLHQRSSYGSWGQDVPYRTGEDAGMDVSSVGECA